MSFEPIYYFQYAYTFQNHCFHMIAGSPGNSRLCRIIFTSLIMKGTTPKLLHFIWTGKSVSSQIEILRISSDRWSQTLLWMKPIGLRSCNQVYYITDCPLWNNAYRQKMIARPMYIGLYLFFNCLPNVNGHNYFMISDRKFLSFIYFFC